MNDGTAVFRAPNGHTRERVEGALEILDGSEFAGGHVGQRFTQPIAFPHFIHASRVEQCLQQRFGNGAATEQQFGRRARACGNPTLGLVGGECNEVLGALPGGGRGWFGQFQVPRADHPSDKHGLTRHERGGQGKQGSGSGTEVPMGEGVFHAGQHRGAAVLHALGRTGCA